MTKARIRCSDIPFFSLGLMCMPMLAAAQSADALRNANSSGRNVVSAGLGYDLERYSPLRQINTLTIESLVATRCQNPVTEGRPTR
jgi:hypothetical protein